MAEGFSCMYACMPFEVPCFFFFWKWGWEVKQREEIQIRPCTDRNGSSCFFFFWVFGRAEVPCIICTYVHTIHTCGIHTEKKAFSFIAFVGGREGSECEGNGWRGKDTICRGWSE